MKVSERVQILKQIDGIVAKHCDPCKVRRDLVKHYGSGHSAPETNCIKGCAIGMKLQELGQQLKRPDRREQKCGMFLGHL